MWKLCISNLIQSNFAKELYICKKNFSMLMMMNMLFTIMYNCLSSALIYDYKWLLHYALTSFMFMMFNL